MLISKLRIKNFRSIRLLELDLSETTVLIGQNNAGKSAILEAVRIALTRRWGQRGTGFTEYDVHLQNETSDPKTSDPVEIEVELSERQVDDWPPDLRADLDDIIQLDPVAGKASIILRVSCAWDDGAGSYVPRWEFLNVQRMPLTGKSARATNLQEFFQYLPVFYLSALRDADDEFSPRSQFWGRLLRTVDIPEKLANRAKKILDGLNKRILGADPLLAKIAGTLSGITNVAARDDPGQVDLRMVPLRPWDLLSRAEVIFRAEPARPWLPLQRHGQGIQSLSVLFLFHAFVEHLLSELFKPDSTPVLALEEPETHLHPQAARALWRDVHALPGQKLVATHSPYFLQHAPFRDIRIIRMSAQGTTVSSLPSEFGTAIPHVSGVDPVAAGSGSKIRYDHSVGELIVQGILEESAFRALLTAYASHPKMGTIHQSLRDLCDRSQKFIADDELEKLEVFARRIRGEVFFAHRWLLVEGQCEYLLAHALGRALGYDLDAHGVAVIDCQNNGNPHSFAALARALDIPWLAVFDGDPKGQEYLRQIERRGFQKSEITLRCKCHANGTLEQQLMADGLEGELRSILLEIGELDAGSVSEEEISRRLKARKTDYAAVLARRIVNDPVLAKRMPEALRVAIGSFRGLQ